MKTPNYVPKLVHPSYNQADIRESRVKAGLPRYKIAIIDSGYDPSRSNIGLKLCKEGHYNYQTKTATAGFTHVHGTRVADLIATPLKDLDYCAIVYQVVTDDVNQISLENTTDAINLAIAEQVDAINYSMAGTSQSPTEKAALQTAANIGIPVFIAAGNHGLNLDKTCNIFPPCYKIKGITVVGAQDYDSPKHRAKTSNYGKIVDFWAPGYYKNVHEDLMYFGTSYAAPRALSEFILFLEHKRLKPKK